jgi:hypothetical protein
MDIPGGVGSVERLEDRVMFSQACEHQRHRVGRHLLLARNIVQHSEHLARVRQPPEPATLFLTGVPFPIVSSFVIVDGGEEVQEAVMSPPPAVVSGVQRRVRR